MDVPDAAGLASSLVDSPHALVGSAVGVWYRGPATARLSDWTARLPDAVECANVVDQARVDAWASERTHGLIPGMPVDAGPDTALVLATAVATRVSWEQPFDVVPAAALGPGSAWAGRLRHALRTPVGAGHRQYLARTACAGLVAVHTAEARPEETGTQRQGLSVTSVIAAPGVAAPDVLAAAHEVAAEQAERCSLFDVPLDETPLWTIQEEEVPTIAADGREERYAAVLPAWSVRSEHDLAHAALGVPAAAAMLGELAGVGTGGYQAKQAAMARYDRVGFEAGAVTAVAVPLGFVRPRDGVRRTAELRFAHPYATIAVATQHLVDRRTGDWSTGPWHGVPVFSAWVAEPEEPG
jgi:hypothetical protein